MSLKEALDSLHPSGLNRETRRRIAKQEKAVLVSLARFHCEGRNGPLFKEFQERARPLWPAFEEAYEEYLNSADGEPSPPSPLQQVELEVLRKLQALEPLSKYARLVRQDQKDLRDKFRKALEDRAEGAAGEKES